MLSLWTTWLAERKRTVAIASFCHEKGYRYAAKIKAWAAFVETFRDLPLLQKGDPSKLKHEIIGETVGLQFQVLDYEYAGTSYLLPSATSGGHLLETGRKQTVLLWTNPPAGIQDFVLEPRRHWLKKVGSLFVGDALDYSQLGLQETDDRRLGDIYAVWTGASRDATRIPDESCDELRSERQPWTVEHVGSSLAIYRPSRLWPKETYVDDFNHALKIARAFSSSFVPTREIKP